GLGWPHLLGDAAAHVLVELAQPAGVLDELGGRLRVGLGLDGRGALGDVLGGLLGQPWELVTLPSFGLAWRDERFCRHHRASTSWPMRLAAISQYRSSSSMPIALRPRSLAARSVV